ncbi:G patch domain-containing protein 2-like isoform X3 [Homarus americanus]|uniref:G patch domain-containing protein 2-like isoform X3 n=1 Tax=Homarus americanus TaxID=6706 RepID=UPI001C4581E5|nr:G patch domain-containing protein 2-like isoform X3 [Homarus americanus]
MEPRLKTSVLPSFILCKLLSFTKLSGMASGGGDRLRVVTAENLRHKMDALVSDLSHALDESQLPQYHRKRRGFKRRVKLANNLSLSTNRALSEDSSSSIGEVVLSQDNKSSIPLTDSDDMSPPPELRHRTQLLTHQRAPSNLAESDSVNENFSPARPHNRSVNPFLCRKRKCKRLALDPDAPSTSTTQASSGLPMAKPTAIASAILSGASNGRRKKVLRPSPDSECRYLAISAGKRKRGRERSVEWCGGQHVSHSKRHGSSSSHFHNLRVHRASQPSTEDSMEYDHSDDANMEHSSSESSTESETGIYTCDEGREADDEQSDWFAEPDPVYGVPGSTNTPRQRNASNRLSWWNDNEFGLSSSAKALFKERYETMSVENQQACRLRFQKLRERLLRREIRAGRRRIRDRKPGFSIVSSVNDKVSRFLQDPRQSELRLKPMTDKDRDQLNHLADLYSLTIRSSDDQTAPILTKTRCVAQHRNCQGNTITKQRLEADGETLACGGSFPGGLPVPLSDLKRRRRTPPPPTNNLTEGSNDSVESISNSAGLSGTMCRPPVPSVSWDDDVGDCCADSLSERLADSEPEPLPSPTSLGLHDCTL